MEAASCRSNIPEYAYGGVDINRNYPTCFEYQNDDQASSGSVCRSVGDSFLVVSRCYVMFVNLVEALSLQVFADGAAIPYVEW